MIRLGKVRYSLALAAQRRGTGADPALCLCLVQLTLTIRGRPKRIPPLTLNPFLSTSSLLITHLLRP